LFVQSEVKTVTTIWAGSWCCPWRE